MATAQVEHPVPTAVHDGSCYQEEENHHKIPVQDDMAPATEVEEEAPGAEEVQVHADGFSKEEAPKGHQEDDDYHSKENPKQDPRHEDEDEAAIATDDDRLMQSVAREVEAKLKLGIVQGDVESAAIADDEPKMPNKEAPAERRPKLTMKSAAAKAVVVPVDDDDDLVDGEAVAAPAEAAPREDPEKEDEGADKGEEVQEEKAHEE